MYHYLCAANGVDSGKQKLTWTMVGVTLFRSSIWSMTLLAAVSRCGVAACSATAPSSCTTRPGARSPLTPRRPVTVNCGDGKAKYQATPNRVKHKSLMYSVYLFRKLAFSKDLIVVIWKFIYREGSNRKGFGSGFLPRQWLVWQL